MRFQKLTEITTMKMSYCTTYVSLPREWVKGLIGDSKKQIKLEVFTRGNDLLLRPLLDEEVEG